MPISRREFEGGKLDPSLLIIGFLRSNADYAYTVEELLEELVSRGMDLTAEDMQGILRSLEKQDKIEAKMMRGVVYYIYRKPRLGFRVEGR